LQRWGLFPFILHYQLQDGIETIKGRSHNFSDFKYDCVTIKGSLAPDDDLLFPKFYIAEGLADWLEETVKDWIKQRPNRMK